MRMPRAARWGVTSARSRGGWYHDALNGHRSLAGTVGALAGILLLAACVPIAAEHSRAATLTVLAEVCNTYSSALRTLTPFRAAGLLSDAEVAQVNQANAVADSVCLPGSPAPADPLETISMINAKVIQLLLIRERKGGVT